MNENFIPCRLCSTPIHPARHELMDGLCIGCKNERPYVGNVEGVGKQGSLNMAKAGSEEARRMFNLGNAVIRRATPKGRIM